jgi:hypothetical protein
MAASKPMDGGRSGSPKPRNVTLNWRLYRLCLAPVVAAALILAFSVGGPPAPLGSHLTPEAFEGSHAFETLTRLASIAEHGEPRATNRRLIEYLRSQLGSLGSPASGGYTIGLRERPPQTTSGAAPQSLLIAKRAGTTTQEPIALIASYDALGKGGGAQLSGAAALLQLASVLSQGETRHPLYIVFSDSASSGQAALISWLRTTLGGRLDTAIVLGDLAGARTRQPIVQPFSTGFGLAPETLTRTIASALNAESGPASAPPSLASQLSHLAFPVAVGTEGPINGMGIPSVEVSLGGEGGEAQVEKVSESRLQAAGRAILSAFYSLDHGGEVDASQSVSLQLSGRLLPEWPIALLTLTLLLAPLLTSGEALVRLARRPRQHVRRWMLAPLLCAWPFALFGVSLALLAAIGLLNAPSNPLAASALSFDAGDIVALALALFVLAGSWWAWPKLMMMTGPRKVPASGVAAVAALCSGCLLALLVWLIDPYTTLLLIPALHAWLAICLPKQRPADRRVVLSLLLIPALAPLALLLCFYALSLGLGPLQMLLEGMVMVGGGYVSLGGVALWSVAFGVLVAMGIANVGALTGGAPAVHPPPAPREMLRARGKPVYRERALR